MKLCDSFGFRFFFLPLCLMCVLPATAHGEVPFLSFWHIAQFFGNRFIGKWSKISSIPTSGSYIYILTVYIAIAIYIEIVIGLCDKSLSIIIKIITITTTRATSPNLTKLGIVNLKRKLHLKKNGQWKSCWNKWCKQSKINSCFIVRGQIEVQSCFSWKTDAELSANSPANSTIITIGVAVSVL